MGNARENNLTPQQEAAITYRGGTLLVSSAAGSGKTMVLVERLLGYIDEKRNIDEFLVITYTRAAAAELRERIYEKLQERLAKSPQNMHLRRQSMLCRGAFIDTIHAFCAVVLRENAHLVGLPPDFRVADEKECSLIKIEVMEKVFNRTYDKTAELYGLSKLLDMTVDGRDDGKLVEIAYDIHARLRSTPDPEGWIQSQLERETRQDAGTDVLQTEYGSYLMELLRARTMYCYNKMLEIKDEMGTNPDFKQCYEESVEESVRLMRTLIDAMGRSWDEAVENAKITFPRPKPIKGYDELKASRQWCKAEMAKIGRYLEIGSEDHNNDARTISPAISALLQLVMDFDEAYAEEKGKRGVVDFSDLEHLTLALLIDKETGNRTAVAKALSNRFVEIMVDEYQDVNEVQERLFHALSQNGSNIFMVGDVKQSIYRFRLAEPEIFLKKYRQFENVGAGLCARPQNPVKINLSMNFRSHPGILETINHIFKGIMSPTLGEMEYSDAEALIPGTNARKGKQGIQGMPVEMDILSMSNLPETDEESPNAIQLEARHVAERIKELIDLPYMVEDKDGNLREIKYSDIAILSRSVRGITWRYAAALTDMGIPSDVPASESYFEEVGVQLAMSLLSVIDNPMQDIPLAAVLSSPLYGFTSDELSEIRAVDMNASFYEALKRSAEPDTVSPSTACKCKDVLDRLQELRAMAYDLPADRFIWSVYNKTGLLEKVAAMKDGERRKENLLALAEYARSFESSGYKGLYGFLSFIGGLRERGVDIADADARGAAASGKNAVKVISIHKSKGLEFPVVFLVNTAKKHNMTDLRKPFVFHKALGVGGTITDKEKRIRYTTLARTAIAEKLKQETLSEELRVLYVAMTRAREKLVITATFADAQKRFDSIKLLLGPFGERSPQALLTMNSLADWLLAGTMDIPAEHMQLNWIDAKDIAAEHKPEAAEETDEGTPPEPDLSPDPALAERFSYKYPFDASTRIPSKLTVTGIKSITSSDEDPEAEKAPWLKPLFASPTVKMTPAERGTLLHEVMRHIDYSKCSNESDIRDELQRMIELRLLDEKDVASIDKDIGMIANLFKTGLGKRMQKAASLSREFKFSLLVPAERYYDGGGDDKVLLQGMIDCFFEENGKLVVVDFKTDRVNSKNIDEAVKKYAPQLEGYGEALERITKKQVSERIIYFFEMNKAVSI